MIELALFPTSMALIRVRKLLDLYESSIHYWLGSLFLLHEKSYGCWDSLHWPVNSASYLKVLPFVRQLHSVNLALRNSKSHLGKTLLIHYLHATEHHKPRTVLVLYLQSVWHYRSSLILLRARGNEPMAARVLKARTEKSDHGCL